MTSFRTILSAAILLALAPITQAEDLLYVRTDNKLYTCDKQTGELTYLTDGTLQWIASPSFDEPHHTALYVVPGEMVNHDGSYYWGNPVTGQSAGPYTASLSTYELDYDHNGLESFAIYGSPPDGSSVYVPTTERLYAMAESLQESNIIVPVMVDQYNGTPVAGWGELIESGGRDNVRATALAYDPTHDVILVGWLAGFGNAWDAFGIVRLDPHTGHWLNAIDPGIYDPSDSYIRITSIAVDPANGDIYHIQATFTYWGTGTGTLYRNGQVVATGPNLANWTLRFADAKWAELATPP